MWGRDRKARSLTTAVEVCGHGNVGTPVRRRHCSIGVADDVVARMVSFAVGTEVIDVVEGGRVQARAGERVDSGIDEAYLRRSVVPSLLIHEGRSPPTSRR